MPRGRIGALVFLAVAAMSLWPAGAATAGGGCHLGATQGSGNTVAMSKLCFTPSVVQVDPGTEVTFVNKDPIAHNVSAEWGTSLDLDKGDTFKATFAQEGTFPYACTYHFGMTGAVVVGDGIGPGGRVTAGAPVQATPVSQDRAGGVTVSETSPLPGWTLAGGVGMLLGAGLARMLMGRRREA